jgi:hypothetical protein
MVIGKLKYVIEPVHGHTSHRLDMFSWAHGECESNHAWCRTVIRVPLYSRMVALFHETQIKGKNCACDCVSNHKTCI